MSDFDRPKIIPSKTPRVDRAERFLYTNTREPVGFVLASVAKLLEVELNQALATLKAGQHLQPDSPSVLLPATPPLPLQSRLQAEPFDVKEKPQVSVPTSPQAAAATPFAKVQPVEPRLSEGEESTQESGPRPQLIQPTKSPEGAGESVDYEDGQVLFNKGDNANHLSMVLEGSVEIFDPVGNMRLAILGAGSSFGEQAILEGGIRNASVKALGKVKCLEIKTGPLRALLKQENGLLLQTIEGLQLQLSMCNQISKMIVTPDADLVYELLGDESLTSIQLKNKLNDAYNNPDSHGLSSEQMMYLKLQSSEKLMSNWFESGKALGSPSSEHLGFAYVIVGGSVEAKCGRRNIRLGRGSLMGLAEGITGAPFSWTLVANEHLTVKSISIDKVLRGLERSNPGIRGIVRYTTYRILELQKTFGL